MDIPRELVKQFARGNGVIFGGGLITRGRSTKLERVVVTTSRQHQ